MRRGLAVLNNRVLMWAAVVALLAAGLLSLAAPVIAQNNINIGDDIEYNAVCQNIIGSIGDINQLQIGNANASANASAVANGETTGGANAEANAEAVAEVAQEQGVSIAQVNECLNGAADNGTPGGPLPGGNTTDGNTTGGNTTGGNTTGSNTTGGGTSVLTNRTVPADVIVGTIPKQKVLADTGGPLILFPAVGLLFLTAGAALLKVLLQR